MSHLTKKILMDCQMQLTSQYSSKPVRNESVVLIPFIFISILALRKKTDGCRLTWMLYIQVGSGFTKPLDSYPREDANWFVSVTKNNECSYIDRHCRHSSYKFNSLAMLHLPEFQKHFHQNNCQPWQMGVIVII